MKADLLSRQRLFLSSKSFAVVGASKDESKYGTTVTLLDISFKDLYCMAAQGSSQGGSCRCSDGTWIAQRR